LSCLTNVASHTGQGEKSYALLSATQKKNADAEPGLKVWVFTLLAEMAMRNGDRQAAENHCHQALMLDRADSYLLGAYADLLLDQKRWNDVIDLLKNHTRIDGLLLRYALALRAQDTRAANESIEILRSRFHAARLRGDSLHRREEARFELHLRQHPHAALELAQQNWQVQKEPADVRIFLEVVYKVTHSMDNYVSFE